jgi:hypothetical protein
MLAARCRDGCPATAADFVAARRPIVVTARDTAAMAAATTDGCPTTDASAATITTGIATSGSGTAAASGATSSTSSPAPTFGQRGPHRQSSDCESDHEHSE